GGKHVEISLWVGLQALVKKKTIGTRCGNGCSDGSHRSDQHLSKAVPYDFEEQFGLPSGRSKFEGRVQWA
ncbi:MAG: hypothetical protein ACI8TQ_002638, partial [Planctomycetota bacterium]